MNRDILGTAELSFIGLYLLSLLVVGYIARRHSQESTLKDFYLAGGSLGFVSLFFLPFTPPSTAVIPCLPYPAWPTGIPPWL